MLSNQIRDSILPLMFLNKLANRLSISDCGFLSLENVLESQVNDPLVRWWWWWILICHDYGRGSTFYALRYVSYSS